MKTISALFLTLLASSVFAGDVWVQPYTKADGTYVQGHHRTAPDNTLQNNYSTQGNTNPYTGQAGTVNPYQQPQQQHQAPQQPQYIAPIQPNTPYQPYQNQPYNPYAK